MKIFNFELTHKSFKIKDKKQAYAILDSLNKNEIEEAEDKYIYAKGYKHIKNLYQLFFNFFSNENELDRSGKCIVCGNDTPFNLLTRKYARLDKESCKEKYIEEFKNRMKNVHGREYFTQDPEAQKKMLNNRELTTDYEFKGFKYKTVGNYEIDFLDFMFKILKCNPADLIECPFHINYEYHGVSKFYIPDFYIPSLKLVVEIKSSKSAYADRDRGVEEAKRIAGMNYMRKQGGYYFYLIDKNYIEFLDYLRKIIEKQ